MRKVMKVGMVNQVAGVQSKLGSPWLVVPGGRVTFAVGITGCGLRVERMSSGTRHKEQGNDC